MNEKIALVYPYFRTNAREQMLFQPLGIALLSACIKRLNLDARQFDCTFEDIWRVTACISEYAPSVVGIYIMATMSENAMRLLTMLRSMLPKTLFVAGGPLATVYPGEFARSFDVVFRGEADIGFPKFCRDYVRMGHGPTRFMTRMNLSVYPGIFVRNDDVEMGTPQAGRDENELGDLPLPDRAGGAYQKFQAEWSSSTGRKPATIMTTYGCPFHCDFCSKPIFGNRFRKKPVRSVMSEIENIKSLGYDSLWIADDCFTLDREYMLRLCSAFADEEIGMDWSCLSRVDKVDPQIAYLMKSAGCSKVYLGLESGSDATLALMNKRTTVRQGMEAVRVFKDAGIKTAGFFMVGYPGESMSSIGKTFDLALRSGLDEISFTVPYPLPGSPLYERIGRGNPMVDWHFENEVKFLYESEFDRNTLEQMIDRTIAAFERDKTRTEVLVGAGRNI